MRRRTGSEGTWGVNSRGGSGAAVGGLVKGAESVQAGDFDGERLGVGGAAVLGGILEKSLLAE
jgi:hypothetical protein